VDQRPNQIVLLGDHTDPAPHSTQMTGTCLMDVGAGNQDSAGLNRHEAADGAK
jgi:hypothetical protein